MSSVSNYFNLIKKIIFFFFILFCLFSFSFAQTEKANYQKNTAFVNWSSYQSILNKVVEEKKYSGQYGEFSHNSVDYQTLTTEESIPKLISTQIELLENLSDKQVKSLAKGIETGQDIAVAVAFWIDIYNFYTLVAIQREYPIKSMQEIGWKKKNCIIGKKTYSLDEVENEILRPLVLGLKKFKNPADIHFAINCASVGCPQIRKAVYSQKDLDVKTLQKELAKNVYEGLKNPLHFQIKSKGKGGVVLISSIFDWFKSDFEAQSKKVIRYLKKYAPEDAKFSRKSTIKYLQYNWDINTTDNISKSLK